MLTSWCPERLKRRHDGIGFLYADLLRLASIRQRIAFPTRDVHIARNVDSWRKKEFIVSSITNIDDPPWFEREGSGLVSKRSSALSAPVEDPHFKA